MNSRYLIGLAFALGGCDGETSSSSSSIALQPQASVITESNSSVLPAGIWTYDYPYSPAVNVMISDSSGTFFAYVAAPGPIHPMYTGILYLANGVITGDGTLYLNDRSNSFELQNYSGLFDSDSITNDNFAYWNYSPVDSSAVDLSQFSGTWTDGTWTITIDSAGSITGDCTGLLSNNNPDNDVFTISFHCSGEAEVGLATLWSTGNIGIWTTSYDVFSPESGTGS